jgi:hypothetical protein
MGTRSLTRIYDENGEQIINMYRQFDGYPTGHGQELSEFLNSGKMVNGIPVGKPGHVFNGMGCLAAQVVSNFKSEAGGFYLYPVSATDCGQEYEYHIYEDRVEVYDSFPSGKLFTGSWKEFEKYCSTEHYVIDPTDQDQITECLKNGKVEVLFTKVDGTERRLLCTLHESLIPISTPETKAVVRKRVPNTEVMSVWDIESKGWRSFRWDSLIKAEIV